MSPSSKCVIILSSKSAGSSALQNLLVSYPHVRHVRWTQHHENETLYWVKAASLLGLPLVPTPNRELPLSRDRARLELRELLARNLGSPFPDEGDDRALIFDGWTGLCREFSPVFVEKSPHHLGQWSALELMLQALARDLDVDYRIVGLVRNPMSVLYSMWSRWRSLPERQQHLWADAYRNLLRLQQRLGDRAMWIRYEDMVTKPDVLSRLLDFIEAPARPPADALHARSLDKWRRDGWFGFVLHPAVQDLACEFGYSRDEMMVHRRVFGWQLYRRACHLHHRSSQLARQIRRQLSHTLKATGCWRRGGGGATRKRRFR